MLGRRPQHLGGKVWVQVWEQKRVMPSVKQGLHAKLMKIGSREVMRMILRVPVKKRDKTIDPWKNKCDKVSHLVVHTKTQHQLSPYLVRVASRKPLAKGLLSIFSFVICVRRDNWLKNVAITSWTLKLCICGISDYIRYIITKQL